MKQKTLEVSICIVSYQTRAHLKKCLSSIYRFTKNITFEVIVVDNGSGDGSGDMVRVQFPKVRFVENKNNKWFAGANNQAVRIAKGTYLFFLNSDTWITTNVICSLKEWMDKHPSVGACEPQQIDEQKKIAPTGSKLNVWWIDVLELTVLSRLFGSVGRIGLLKKPKGTLEFRQEKERREENWSTEVVSGAAFFSRTAAIRKVGGFNERLKLYYTDTDLCRKLIREDWTIWHVGKYFLYHSLSVSTSQLSWEERSSIYAGDARTYYGVVGKPIQGWMLYIMMMLSSRFVAVWQ